MKLGALLKMKFFKKKDKRKDASFDDDYLGGNRQYQQNPYQQQGFGNRPAFNRSLSLQSTRRSAALLANFPDNVLKRIFAFVCPHSQDETYERCEDSALEDACMLCDLRDLAHCVLVCKKWRVVARNTLYVLCSL